MACSTLDSKECSRPSQYSDLCYRDTASLESSHEDRGPGEPERVAAPGTLLQSSLCSTRAWESHRCPPAPPTSSREWHDLCLALP